MPDAAPRHVGDVQEAVDAAQIDERAVVGDVLDDALEHLAFGERAERVLLLFRVLFLEQRLARQHDIAALLVHLDDAHAQLLAAQRIQVPDGTHVDLRPGQERAHADVDREPALDALDDATDDDLALGIGLLDLVPDLHLLRFFAREDDVALAVLGALEQHVDDVAGLHRDLAVLVEELVDRDDAFRLVADVDDDFRGSQLENRPLDDLAFRDVSEAAIVDVQQPGVFVRIELIVVAPRPGYQANALSTLGAFGCRAGASGRSGSVLIFNVRHALRVLLCRRRARSDSEPCRRSIDCPSTRLRTS